MKRRMGNCIVRGIILAAMTSMVAANQVVNVFAEDVVPVENFELTDEKEGMNESENAEEIAVSEAAEESVEEQDETTVLEEESIEENIFVQDNYVMAVAETELENNQMVMTVQEATDAELAEEAAEKAQEQADSIEQKIEQIEEAQTVVADEADTMKKAASEVEEAMEKLSQAEAEWESMQEPNGALEEIKQEAEAVESIIQDIESSIDEEGNLTVEIADEEDEAQIVALEKYMEEQVEAVKQAAEQAQGLLENVLNADETVSSEEIDIMIEQVQEVAEQAQNMSQKAQDAYDSAEAALKEEIKKYNAYVSLYGEIYGLEPMLYEDEVLTYTDEELEQANLILSKMDAAEKYRETLVEISTITESIENAKETVEEAEQACINANKEANAAMDAAYQAKNQATEYANQAAEYAEKVEETGNDSEKEQAEAAVEKAESAKKQADDNFTAAMPLLDSMNDELSDAYKICLDAKQSIAEAEEAAKVVLPALDYKADILGMHDALVKKLDLWNKIKANMTNSMEQLRQQNTRVENYTEWTVGLRDSVDVRVYGQQTVDGSGVVADKNHYNFDLTNEEVDSRPQNVFVEVTPEGGTVKTPQNIFKAFVEEMYNKNAIWTDGKGIFLDSVLPMVYWEWDADAKKLTGNYYFAQEDGSIPSELQGKTYFVGYTFKTEADGYHIDGYLETHTISEEDSEPIPNPEPTPEPTPNLESATEPFALSVVIEEEEIPLAASVPVQGIIPVTEASSMAEPSEIIAIEEEGVPLTDVVPRTGDSTLPALPFAVGGFGTMVAAIAINWSKKKKNN